MTSTQQNPDTLSGKVPNANHGETIARTLLERAPVLVYVVDLNFKVVLMNRELREISGWDTSTCGSIDSLLECFYPDPGYREPIHELHRRWANVPSEQVRDTVMVLTTRDGRQRSISWTTARLRVGRGEVKGYIALGVDVTTRRNLEHWVTLFQQSLLHMREALALTDPAGGILAWSAGGTALLGHSEAAVQGQAFTDLLGGTDRAGVADRINEALATNESFSGEVEFLSAAGETCRLNMEQLLIRNPAGEVLATLVQLEDPSGAADSQEEAAPGLALIQAEERASSAEQDLAEALTRSEAAKDEAQALRDDLESERNQFENDLTARSTELEELRAQSQIELQERLDEARAALEEQAAADRAASQAESQQRLDEAEARLEAIQAESDKQLARTCEIAEAERAELEARWQMDTDALAESHALELAGLQERLDTQRTELEEQLARDILAAEERAEVKLQGQEEQHQKARDEWDAATAIATDEANSRYESLKQQVESILGAATSRDGALARAEVARLAALFGAKLPKVESNDLGDTQYDISEDDLILDDEVAQAIDSPPPVSPVMVATASELDALPKPGPAEHESELELDPIELDDLEGDLELPEPEPESQNEEVVEIELDLEIEPTEDDVAEGDLEIEVLASPAGEPEAEARASKKKPKKKSKKKRKKKD